MEVPISLQVAGPANNGKPAVHESSLKLTALNAVEWETSYAHLRGYLTTT